ncbi:hypothetical protein C7B61_00215 [filamentous cyanobacterium CCP1]|nr:hypothetical protein C7B76_31875 [filamentous cyanobacterium CCP2]PSB68605.1 hypothetical protein C7B61_00215 [filamentous cyanobacterium CCP1]
MAIEGGIQSVLSTERIQRYINWASGNLEDGLHLYALNTRLSEALYTPLQMLEITLRNKIHSTMSHHFSENWLENDNIITASNQRDRIEKAKSDLSSERKENTPHQLVTKLMFGFWTTMLNTEYNQLWQKYLYTIATENGRTLSRKQLATPLSKIRTLRNRIAHHEPILHWNLIDHHKQILEITRWLSPVAHEWSQHHSRFLQVYPIHGIQLSR